MSVDLHPGHGAVAEQLALVGSSFREVWCGMCPAWQELPGDVDPEAFLSGHVFHDHGVVPCIA